MNGEKWDQWIVQFLKWTEERFMIAHQILWNAFLIVSIILAVLGLLLDLVIKVTSLVYLFF